MGRHPGIQHSMRLEELAKAMAHASSDVHMAFIEFRRLEEKAAELKAAAEAAQKKLDGLLKLQTELIEAQRVTEFGLPSGMTCDDFTNLTGHRITS